MFVYNISKTRGAKSVEYWKHIGVRGSSNSVSNICLKLIKLYLMTLNYGLRGSSRFCWSRIYGVFMVYRVSKVYRIYRVYKVYRVYTVYTVYTVYRVYRAYRVYSL